MLPSDKAGEHLADEVGHVQAVLHFEVGGEGDAADLQVRLGLLVPVVVEQHRPDVGVAAGGQRLQRRDALVGVGVAHGGQRVGLLQQRLDARIGLGGQRLFQHRSHAGIDVAEQFLGGGEAHRRVGVEQAQRGHRLADPAAHAVVDGDVLAAGVLQRAFVELLEDAEGLGVAGLHQRFDGGDLVVGLFGAEGLHECRINGGVGGNSEPAEECDEKTAHGFVSKVGAGGRGRVACLGVPWSRRNYLPSGTSFFLSLPGM